VAYTATPDDIKKLRELTSAGVMDCKRAIEQAEGDLKAAQRIITEQGLARAEKRADRAANQGVIESYIHQGRIGALVELNCETDFVARTDDFRALAREIAMQVASMNPKYLSKEDVPAEEMEPVAQVALLEQPFIRDGSRTIGQLVIETSAKTGEKVAVRRFSRFELGRD
jgi:elongation factor Ts